MKEYFTISTSPEPKPLHQRKFSVTPRTPFFCGIYPYPGYIVGVLLSFADKASLLVTVFDIQASKIIFRIELKKMRKLKVDFKNEF